MGGVRDRTFMIDEAGHIACPGFRAMPCAMALSASAILPAIPGSTGEAVIARRMASTHWSAVSRVMGRRACADIMQTPGCSTNQSRGPPSQALRKPARDTRMDARSRSEEHTSEIQSLMRIPYAVFCLKKKKNDQ